MSSASSAPPPPTSPRSASASSPRQRLRSTCTKGQYDGAPPASHARPQCAARPRAAATRASSSAGRGALGAALDPLANGAPLDPALAARVDELLLALGATDLLGDVSAPQAAVFLAEIRHALGMDAKLPYAHTRGTSWSFHDPLI